MSIHNDDYLRQFFKNYHSNFHTEDLEDSSEKQNLKKNTIHNAYRNLDSFQSRKEINLKAMFESIHNEEKKYKQTLTTELPKIRQSILTDTPNTKATHLEVEHVQQEVRNSISVFLETLKQSFLENKNSNTIEKGYQIGVNPSLSLKTITHQNPSINPFSTKLLNREEKGAHPASPAASHLNPFVITKRKEDNHEPTPKSKKDSVRQSRGEQEYLKDIWEYAPERIPFFEEQNLPTPTRPQKQKETIRSKETIAKAVATQSKKLSQSKKAYFKKTQQLGETLHRWVKNKNSQYQQWREANARKKEILLRQQREAENQKSLIQAEKIKEQKRREAVAQKIALEKRKEQQQIQDEERKRIAEKKVFEVQKKKERALQRRKQISSFARKSGQVIAKSKKAIPKLPQIKNPNIRDSIQVIGMVASVFAIGFLGLRLPGFMAQHENIWNADLFASQQTSIEHLVSEKENPFADVESLPVAGEVQNKSISTNTFLNITPPDTRIVIPKIAKNIPILQVDDSSRKMQDWEKLESDIQEALKDGVVHYPGTALPGDDGNVFVTGHSSYYPWDPGRYKDVFAALHNLEVGDEYFIFHNGKKYRYVIRERKVVPPTDVSVLDQNHSKKESTLMTCTPIGTAKNRLILKADQVAVEY